MTTDPMGTPADFLKTLSDQQREAVVHTGGPLIVVAGPGAGKTRVMTSRIAHLIGTGVAEPRRVLALSFTIKAADELRVRLVDLIGPSAADAVQATTFNSFGASLIRRFADVAGLPVRRTMLDSAQRKRLVRTIAREKGFLARAAAGGLDSAIGLATKRIHAMHNAGVRPGEAIEKLSKAADGENDAGARSELEDWLDAARVWQELTARARAEGLIDYDDQIGLPIELLERDQRVAAMVRTDCKHIVVDEFQDLNASQIRLLRSIAPPGTSADIAVVGDDDQSIYGFRGADDLALPRFEKLWTKNGDVPRTVELGENWRSEACVVEASSAIIGAAHDRFLRDKALVCARAGEPAKAGAAVEAVRLGHYTEDGPTIAAMILHQRARQADLAWSDIAVIARTHNDLSRVQGALELAGVPVELSRQRGAGEDPAVQDVLAWARLLVDPRAAWCVRRILRRPPLAIPEGRVIAWERAYEAKRSRLEAGDGEETALPGSGTLLEFIGDTLPEGDEARGAVDKLLGWQAELSGLAAERRADEVVEAIVRTTGAASADLPESRARARRVSALVALLRFVRDRRGRLEEPGDLRAFLSYYDDLDDSDKSLEPDREDAEASPDGSADAVQLLTAHGAKGLEFDTVYIPRVAYPSFPSRASEDDEGALPGCLVETDDLEVRTGEQAHADEERRLFYVALTRAERRAVALGTLPKKLGKSTYYLNELMDAGAVVRTGDEVIEAAKDAGVFGGDAAQAELMRTSADAFGVALAEEKRRARDAAAAALDLADRAGVDGDDFDAIGERLVEAARRLGAVSAVGRGGDVPGWASGETGSGARRLSDVRAGMGHDAHGLAPMRGPLRLSYSMVDQYERCGLCFYLRYVEKLSEGFDERLGVGNAAHRAMERFTKETAEADSEGRELPGREWLLDIGREEVLKAWPRGEVVPAGTVEQVRAQLGLTFDGLVGEGDHTIETEFSVRFGYPAPGGPHTMVAKLDRVDQLGEGYRIIDYKTGRASKKLLEPKADDRQLGIYAMAAREAFGEDVSGTAEYWVLSTGERGVIGLDDLFAKEAKLRKKIDEAVEGMLAGRYERGDRCSGPCLSVFPVG
ncbi:MAG: ATP-dependent DNA helicase [Planctomycetota bacterium]